MDYQTEIVRLQKALEHAEPGTREHARIREHISVLEDLAGDQVTNAPSGRLAHHRGGITGQQLREPAYRHRAMALR